MSTEIVEHTATPQPPYSVAEAAERLGVSRSTAYELIARDDFPVPVIRIGRQIRVPRQALDRLLNTGHA